MQDLNNLQRQSKQINRGDIWLVNLPFTGNSIQGGGIRPMIVASNSMCCKHSSVIHAIPTTGQSKKWIPTHVKISASSSGLLRDSIALCEQVMLLPKDSFQTKVGSCSDPIISKLNQALSIQFGLEYKNNIVSA